jgi:hypothetical protein
MTDQATALIQPAMNRWTLDGFNGEIIHPHDERYDSARGLYVTGFDFKPSVIARPVDAVDVSRLVRFASAEGIEIAVRSGGHSLAGHSGTNGGLLIDLSLMRAILIDTSTRTAWAEAGATAGEYTRAAGEYGLATGFGDSPTVGVGGITLGGGIGFLHRAYGMTIDNVVAAEIVTASGEVVHVDAESHPDLFWAIRGGGGNFGVATRFQYRLHEVGEVLGGLLMLPANPAILETLVAELDAAPDELSGMLTVAMAPPVPAFPAEIHGRPIIMAALVHCGNPPASVRADLRWGSGATSTGWHGWRSAAPGPLRPRFRRSGIRPAQSITGPGEPRTVPASRWRGCPGGARCDGVRSSSPPIPVVRRGPV